jgi:hypothetical protein
VPTHAVSLRAADPVVAVKPRRFRFRAGGITIHEAVFYACPVFIPLTVVSSIAAGLSALILPVFILAWDRVRWLDVHDDGRLVAFSLTRVVRFTANEVVAARWVRTRSRWEQRLLFEMNDGTHFSCRATTIPTERRGELELSYLEPDVRSLLLALSAVSIPTTDLSRGVLDETPPTGA